MYLKIILDRQVQHLGTMLIYWKITNNIQNMKTKVIIIKIQVKKCIYILQKIQFL